MGGGKKVSWTKLISKKYIVFAVWMLYIGPNMSADA